jgi:hypothetical protein
VTVLSGSISSSGEFSNATISASGVGSTPVPPFLSQVAGAEISAAQAQIPAALPQTGGGGGF